MSNRKCLTAMKWMVTASRLSGSEEDGVMGLSLMMPSAMVSRVRRLSSPITCSLVRPARTLLTILIWRSHTPPMCEAWGGLKAQDIP